MINQGVQKRWQVTFRDMISKVEPLGTYYEVESYKEYNKIEDDHYKKEKGWEAEYKRFKMLEKMNEEKNEVCNCAIF